MREPEQRVSPPYYDEEKHQSYGDEDSAYEEYRQRRREKEADEGYELNDPKRSDYLDRLYDCED